MSAFASSLYYSIFKNLDQFVSLYRRLPGGSLTVSKNGQFWNVA